MNFNIQKKFTATENFEAKYSPAIRLPSGLQRSQAFSQN